MTLKLIVEKLARDNKKFILSKSDEPGNYDPEILKEKLIEYFKDKRKIPQAIKNILLPLCLKNSVVTRDMIKKEILSQGMGLSAIVPNISTQMGLEKNDFLKGVIYGT